MKIIKAYTEFSGPRLKPVRKDLAKDITGMRSGLLVAVRNLWIRDYRRMFIWEFHCDCGNILYTAIRSFLSGDRTSCGCGFIDRRDQTGEKNNMYRHGMFGTRIHKIWDGMIQRCTNSNCKDYKNWGGRGIKVCEEWSDFVNFYRDMGDVPETGVKMSLGRIDNEKGYSKKNCEWQTWKQQHRNKRNSRIITIGGVTKNLSAWLEDTGLTRTFFMKKFKTEIKEKR